MKPTLTPPNEQQVAARPHKGKFLPVPDAYVLATWGDRKLDNAIARGHALAGTHLRNYEMSATATGVLLIERKRRVGHGNWLAWLATNFDGTRRTASTYMQMGEAWIEANGKSASHLDPASEAPDQLALPACEPTSASSDAEGDVEVLHGEVVPEGSEPLAHSRTPQPAPNREYRVLAHSVGGARGAARSLAALDFPVALANAPEHEVTLFLAALNEARKNLLHARNKIKAPEQRALAAGEATSTTVSDEIEVLDADVVAPEAAREAEDVDSQVRETPRNIDRMDRIVGSLHGLGRALPDEDPDLDAAIRAASPERLRSWHVDVRKSLKAIRNLERRLTTARGRKVAR